MNKEEIKKRLEIMGEALQTAIEAILELQAEHKLLNYITQDNNPDT